MATLTRRSEEVQPLPLPLPPVARAPNVTPELQGNENGTPEEEALLVEQILRRRPTHSHSARYTPEH